MAQKVNLDALIPREDFEVSTENNQSQVLQTIQIRDLEPGAFFYIVIRKPDFQRETAEWDPAKICDFVGSFLKGDLIPALILWHSGTQIFVIDGAHRLSALVAWVHDDYGDGTISKAFFDGIIPEEQIRIANDTRRLVRTRLGSYDDHRFAIQNPDKATPELLARAKRLASLGVQLQWVKGGAENAEASFFKINQQAAPINKTELRLLKSRKKANAIAARAIIRSGTGHKYWSRYDDDTSANIQAIGKQINATLFTPTLKTPIKTLDLPVAGKGYSAQTLPLIYDLVNVANDVRSDESLKEDPDGSSTVQFLKKCQKIVNRISGLHPSSLGLHPAVYFYSRAGRYHTAAFFAMVGLIKRLEATDGFEGFTRVRATFEDFLLKHKIFSTQIVFRSGSGVRSYSRLQALYERVLAEFGQGKGEREIVDGLLADPEFSFLQPNEPEEVGGQSRDFDSETKSAAFLREALTNPIRCKICGGLVHANSISIDHVVRREDGGRGTLDNAQLTHPYCNTTIKN